ncbi:MAG: SDR family oxidoreductase [Clostridiales bacterium]|jgi:NAD(P)-dependent dehydrogenase (short-subunit alcohol dehydrogenase family)|nr:SDR family oxidoreductase [Clostridiales bacterium]
MKYASMLEGRYALILGGASQVGRAVAQTFAEHGARVAVADEDRQRTCEAFADLKEKIPGVAAFTEKLAAPRMKDLCSAVLSEFPYVDILVGATDLYKTGEAHLFSISDLRQMLGVNLGCAVRCFQELLPGMKKNRRGDVVLFAPDLVDAALPNTAAAAACAGAINSFARNATFDYIRYHIRVNTALYPFDGHPGREPLTGSPESLDAANAALWYACDLSRFVTGETLNVNGGMAYMQAGFERAAGKAGVRA